MITVPVTQTQLDALVSLGFNYGSGGLEHSAVVSTVNAGRGGTPLRERVEIEW
jgi:GH24 family phage-related lysozyme (muramidase)